MLRAGLVKNCRRCKSSVRLNCVLRKKTGKKDYTDNKKTNWIRTKILNIPHEIEFFCSILNFYLFKIFNAIMDLITIIDSMNQIFLEE